MHKYTLLKFSGLILLVLFFFIFQSVRWSGENGALKAHNKFIDYFSERRLGKCSNMISELYSDQWNFNNEEISLALRDLAKYFFLSFEVNWEDHSIRFSEDSYLITGTLKIEGSGNQVTDFIMKEMRKYQPLPFTFHWSKSGMTPWSWEITKIEHPTLSVPNGYIPGKSLNSLRW